MVKVYPEIQLRTSKNTSINKKQLPMTTKHINWEAFRNRRVLDYGAGRYPNLKNYLRSNYNVELLMYDPFWQPAAWNYACLYGLDYSAVVCNNCLNVIDDEVALFKAAQYIEKSDKPFFVRVYEGDGSCIGRETKKDCWQRNEPTIAYADLFNNVCIKNGIITNAPEYLI